MGSDGSRAREKVLLRWIGRVAPDEEDFCASEQSWNRHADARKKESRGFSLIDSLLAGGTRSGYNFLYNVTSKMGANDGFTVNANPIKQGFTGNRYFYIDQTNVLRGQVGSPAGPNSLPTPSGF